MQTDMFLKLGDIKGESHDSKHKDEIEIENYSFGVHQQGTASHGSGMGAGIAHFQDFTFTKRVDKATPTLFQAAASGKHIDEALLTVRKAGGKQEEYLKVTLKGVIISSYSSSGGHGAVPGETVCLNFSEVQYEYSPQKKTGSLDGSVQGGWKLKEREVVA